MGNKFEVSLTVSEAGRRRPEYSLETDLNGEITLQDLLAWTKETLIITADQILKEEQDSGFDKNPVMLVDGRRSKNPLNVSPLGTIEFVARMPFGEILVEAYEGLLGRSKVLKGDYKSSHYVFHNGHQVANDLSSLKTWLATSPQFNEKDTVRIVNIQPYARRLEMLGVTAQRSSIKQDEAGRRQKKPTGKFFKVPNGAYQLTTRAIRAKYKQNSIIRFTFLQGNQLGLSGSFKSGRKGKNSSGRPYLYPTLVFTISTRGLVEDV